MGEIGERIRPGWVLEEMGRPGALGPCALVVASPGRAVHRGAINCAKRAILRVGERGKWEWIRG